MINAAGVIFLRRALFLLRTNRQNILHGNIQYSCAFQPALHSVVYRPTTGIISFRDAFVIELLAETEAPD